MKNIAVFASGEGTNFDVIAEACEQGAISAKVVLMVCDKPAAKVVEKAAQRGKLQRHYRSGSSLRCGRKGVTPWQISKTSF